MPEPTIADVLARLEALAADVHDVRRAVNRGATKYRKRDAADRLGLSVRTVESRIKEGRLRAVREGKLVYVTEDACLDYEAAERRAA